MNENRKPTPRLVDASHSVEGRDTTEPSADGGGWVRPVCLCVSVLGISVAAVKVAEQPDGANKLRALAGVMSAVVALDKAT